MELQDALFESVPIRVGVVEGASETRRLVLPLLEADADVHVAAVHSEGSAAVESLRREPVDILFLDVDLEDLDGFQVLHAAGSACAGAVVLMTAKEEHALRAFEAGALDCLLKSRVPERFAQVLGRAKEHVRRGRLQQLVRQLAGLVRTLPVPSPAPRYLDRLVIREVGRVTLLAVDDVDWMAAEDNYVQVHVGERSHLLRQPMRELEARLDPERFVRIHRSTLVNVQRVQELRPLLHGEYQVILRDRTTLKLSRGYRERLGLLLAQG
ncbi:response regulator transcription factor [Corallococcus exiguus]|uniref:LytR/AlgR family response regulator transcription factor n=1 Tax=Corallococcus exiguus TaxID=83462 RepID=UPI001494AFD5|nr:LytTR family DNA-binding domain-containing protein [Corallococcus exiguus]NPC68350.1 response regulator transcription factor [Corallococcus exiguus]